MNSENSIDLMLSQTEEQASLSEVVEDEGEQSICSGAEFKDTEIGRIPREWNIVKFKDILIGGTKNGIYKKKEFHGSGTKVVNMGELFAYPRLHPVPMKRIELTENELERFSLNQYDLIFARRSLVAEGAGKCSIVCELDEPTVFESSIIRARPNSIKTNSFFLYYFFNSNYGLYLLDTIRRQVAVAGITGKDLENLMIPLPSIIEQTYISQILSDFDNKIELNRQMNTTLEAIGQALFKHWFVDFEFPNEEGKPYKSSGGEMEETDLGEVPVGWKVGTLGEIVENFDSKRIPLSSREREMRKGIYPYYGATSIMDFVDDYIFDGTYILMGEDGSVIDKNEHPILQYVWGKFWVNNHAHVIQGRGSFTAEYILLLLKQMNIKHIITGAVQLKINQRNMNSLTVIIPTDDSLCSFSNFINPIFTMFREKSDEIILLSEIRDALLPKLMSGEIRVNHN